MNRFILLLLLFVSLEAYSQIVINEVVSSNSSSFKDDQGLYPDCIELYNAGDETVDLQAWSLSDKRENSVKYKIAESVVVEPGGYVVFFADNGSAARHTNFKLSASGQFIGISDPNGVWVDSIVVPALETDMAYGRQIDGNMVWAFFNMPTIGSANQGKIKLPQPEFSYDAGFYADSIDLSISVPSFPDVEIRYTVDGREPSIESPLYSGSIPLSSTVTVKARAFAEGKDASKIAYASYFINEREFDLPVVVVSTDYNSFFHPDSGMYEFGLPDYEPEMPHYGANFWDDREEPVSFELFVDGKLVESSLAGAKIFGNYSRALEQKSISINCRNEYENARIDYSVFPDQENIDRYKNIVLRNSGNDYNETMFRDAMIQQCAKDFLDIDYQAYQPAAVFVCGRYMGIFNMREKINEHFVAAHHNVDPDDVNLLFNDYQVIEGSNAEMLLLIDHLKKLDMSIDEDYNEIASQIDIDEFINYQAVEIYVRNTDWPGNNVKYWKEQDKGKWRWILFDTDFGFGIWGNDANHNTLEFATQEGNIGWPNPDWSTLLLRKLLENKTFRNKFIQKLSFVGSVVFAPERVNYVVDSFSAQIENEMNYHVERWDHFSDLDYWRGHIDKMKNFGNERPSYMAGYIEEYFSLSSTYLLAVEVEGEGKVELDDDVFSRDFSAARLYENIPVTLEADPKKGMQFSKWEKYEYAQNENDLIKREDDWLYWADTQTPPDGWRVAQIEENKWATGTAPLGYGESFVNTEINNYVGGDKLTTAYFVKTFTIEDASKAANIMLSYMYDDGLIVYLNGKEVARENMGEGWHGYGDFATTWVGQEGVYKSVSVPASLLRNGENVLAAEVYQASAESSDLVFDASISMHQSYIGDELLAEYRSPRLLVPVDEDVLYRAVFERNKSLVINEVLFAGSKANFVEIYNNSKYAIDLDSVLLKGSVECEFTGKTLQPYSFIVVCEDESKFPDYIKTVTWNSGNLESSGELKLSFTDGVLIDSVSYSFDDSWPEVVSEVAIVLGGFDSDNNVGSNWSVAAPSPGMPFAQDLIEGLYISEVMSNNLNFYGDETGEFSDWIELYNSTSEDIDLAGLFLTDDPANVNKTMIPFSNPEATVVEAGGYIILWADGKQENGPLHLDFSIDKDGEYVGLYQNVDGALELIDSHSFGISPPNYSYAMLANDANYLQLTNTPTPMMENHESVAVSESMEFSFELKIYPVPVKNMLNVSQNIQVESIAVFSQSGQNVLAGKGNSLNCGGLSAGVYFAQIVHEKGVSHISFIKQ